jgi:AcrR family transcriptional regulator
VLLRCKNVKVAQRGPGRRVGLSRDQVLAAALDLVDDEGLAALSMRRLGARLGVEAMTLYHHVPNKDALLDGLVEAVLRDAASDPPDDDWRAALRGYAHRLRAALLAHPGVLPLAVSRPASTPASLRIVERVLGALCTAGFPLGAALDLVNALSVFVLGHAAAEVGVPPGAPGGPAGLDPAQFPLLTRAVSTGDGVDDATRFAAAVDALLDGFALHQGLR